jgi:signal transduction histidine kinase/CheY-like chemotaxis protein/ligand-binding sensor domain-containing protein
MKTVLLVKSKICVFVTGIITLLSISSLPVYGTNNVQFYNLNEKYDVSIRETNEICKDDYGFIWISSKMGVVRYTEDDIRTYQLPYESENIITVRLVYENGILYAYTNNGQVLRYNSIQDKFEMIINISKELRNPYLVVKKMLPDREGRIWFASSFGLFCYRDGTGLKKIGQSQNIRYMEWFDNSRFFYVIDRQIKLYNTTSLSTEDYYTFPRKSDYKVSYLYYDGNTNTLWIGTHADGLFCLKHNGKFKFSDLSEIPNQPILAIEANSDSTLLVGVDGQGIWEINKNRNQVINVYKENSDDPHSLKGNGVYDIYCDDNKRVWICTYSGGVSYFDQANPVVAEINHIVNNPNSLVSNDVNSVLEDSDGNLWFATNNGISCWNVSANQWRSFYHNKKEHAQVFLSLCEDDKGRIWAGTYSSGVYLLDRQSGKELGHFSFEETNGEFNNNFVFDIYKDSQKNIWIGGVSGDLICYLIREERFKSYKNVTVKVITEYRPGQMLIGTTYGLLLLDAKTGKSQTLVEGYLVYDIFLKDEVVWLCTSGNGVVRYDIKTKAIENFSVDSGLPSDFVNSIAYLKGCFWIGTECGLCRMNENGNTISTFNSLPALSNVSFNQNSHDYSKDDKLIWGTNKGVLIFDPNAIHTSQHQGRIYYQDLAISGRSIRESSEYRLEKPLDSLQELSLRYYQSTVSLELIPIGVTSPGSKFSWKMEGLDQEWSKPTNSRILSYSNIPSGTYSLQIRMIDSSLTTVIAQRTIILHVIPPFWSTWWFRILIFAFLIVLSIFLFTYYIDRLKKKHSEEKIRFFANTAHEIRTSLTLIKGPVEELNKEAGLSDKAFYYLHLATEQTQRLLKVVTQLMDFQKVDIGKEKLSLSMVDLVKTIENRVMMFESYARTKNIELKFSSNVSKFVTAVDEAMIEKVIDNLISNAIKYSFPDMPVQVNLQCFSNKWILEVQDHGIGIDKKAQKQLFKEYYRGENAVNSRIVGSGIGLLLVKNYVTLHDGKVSCMSQQNRGSVFQVVMPVKQIDEVVTDQKTLEEKVLQFSSRKNEVNSILFDEPDSADFQKMKVLIVEDHEYLREFLKSAMEAQFHVDLAEDGRQAWSMIQKEAPDLVVSDIMMPNMDGFELCRKLKSTYETSHIPVILLTALSGKAQQLKGLGLGADDYLTKPFDVTLLKHRIKSIIQNREAIREKALKIIKLNENEIILDNELNDKFVKRMVEVVHRNMANPGFSKDDFALAMNVSRSLLYKKAKSLTNQSPTDFIKSVRLDYALDLMRSKKYTITEISELCGFSSVSYFSTVFRKHYGKSPTQIVF